MYRILLHQYLGHLMYLLCAWSSEMQIFATFFCVYCFFTQLILHILSKCQPCCL